MLALATLLFTVSEARLALSLQWVARIQIMPLALSASLTTLGVWLLLTLLLGRIYCSTVCPLGGVQDVVSRIPRSRRQWRLRHPYHFAPPNNGLRYTVLTTVALCGLLGIAVVTSLLDPYSAFGRVCSEMLLPCVEFMGGKEVVIASAAAFAVAFLTLGAVSVAAWRRGRIVCNTVCPVGSLLGLVSRYSLFHFDIDPDVCTGCRSCERVCKSQCISLTDHVVDGSRCVTCFRCVDACPEGAIRYTTRRKRLSIPMLQRVQTAPGSACSEPVRIDRRKFLMTGMIVAAAPALSLAAKAASGASGTDRPLHPVVPPGRRSMAEFLDKCTGCGLCVAHCPGHVLSPSVNQLGWLHALHPVMNYDKGVCLYDCTRCTELCPTGALTPLTVDEKHIFIIGHARVTPSRCIGCGECVGVCPRGATALVPSPEGMGWVSSVNTDLCIGCGACQNVCPASPCKAIIVDGII